MTNKSTRAAYQSRAAEYTRVLGSIDDMHELDRKCIGRWGSSINGQMIDAGCGPGHWTNYLHEGGAAIEGIDLVPEFIDDARARFPGVPFRVGSFQQMDVPDETLTGVLAWYSLIHFPPSEVPQVLAEFARVLVPGGRLLIGFFDGSPGTPFQHAVTTAYYRSVKEMSHLLSKAGFDVLEVEKRQDAGKRAHAAVTATVR